MGFHHNWVCFTNLIHKLVFNVVSRLSSTVLAKLYLTIKLHNPVTSTSVESLFSTIFRLRDFDDGDNNKKFVQNTELINQFFRLLVSVLIQLL